MLAILALVVILAPLINGPIFRKVVHSQLEKALHNLYLDGGFEVGGSLLGTLLGGLELRDVKLQGSRNVRSLALAHAELEFELPALIKGNWGEGLTKIHAAGIDATIDTAKDFPTDPEIEQRKAQKRAKKRAAGKDPRVWENLDALLQQDLEVAELGLRLISDGETSFSLERFGIQLADGTGSIRADKITFPNGESTRDLDGQLSSKGESIIQIRSLDLAEELSIERLDIMRPETSRAAPTLDGEVQLLGGRLTATQESPTRWKAKLASGEIDLASLSDWLGNDLGITGTVDRLDATIDTAADYPLRAETGTRQIAYQDYRTDTATATVAYRKDEILIEALDVRSGASSVTGTGRYQPETKQLSAQAKLIAPDLGELTSLYKLPPVGGSATVDLVDLELAGGKLSAANATVDATNLKYQGATIAELALTATEKTFDLKADLHGDGSNRIDSSGSFDIDATSYQAKAQVNLPDLAALHPTFEAFAIKQRPVGKLAVSWSGSGSIRDGEHQGSAKLPEFDIKLDKGSPVNGQLDLTYAPGSYRLADFTARSDQLSITAAAQLAGERLDVESLRLFNGSQSIASAKVSLPFDTTKLSDLDSFLDQPGEISIKIDSNQLRLADLVAMVGDPIDLAANVDAEVDVRGTLDAPTGTGHLEVLQLRKPSAAEIAPVDVMLDFDLASSQLGVDGTLKHPELEPITIKGSTPLRVQKIADQSVQSIDLALHLPETSLEIAKKYIPALTSASGSASADIRVTGSIETPQLAGDLRIDSPLLRFAEQKIPTISDFKVAIHLEGDRLELQSFRGYVAGGEIEIAGGADLASLSNPLLDLSLTARQALVFRDNNASMRANADLKLSGPFEQAALSGKIGITQSRLFREIEILPIGLPRNAPTPEAPKAPSFASKREIGIVAEPFKNWTVDVAILSDDPFLVRSNLAQGDITSDLRISGTLGEPVPDWDNHPR